MGTKLHLPQSSAPSIEGMRSDQTDAAIIIPDAKPKNTVFTFWEISPLKNHTIALPRAVARNITEKPIAVIKDVSTFSSRHNL